MSSPLLTVLAQQAAQPLPMWWFLLGVFAIFYFLVIRPQRKEQAARQQMLDQLAKHDKVMTHGGIHGTVVSTKDDKVVLKVDESNNTKMTFSKSAIASVLEKKKSKDRE